jgi:hypothetical protein
MYKPFLRATRTASARRRTPSFTYKPAASFFSVLSVAEGHFKTDPVEIETRPT